MQITLLGAILIPLSLFWATNPVRLLQLGLISSVFEAAAALVMGGSFGLQPAMVPGLLFILYIIGQYALGMRYPGEGTVLRTMAPLLYLLFYALMSILILPQAFEGRIMVWPQKIDELALGVRPLQFTFGNVTQSLYLAIDVVLTLTVAMFLTRRTIPYKSVIGAYLIGGYIVVFLVLWQLASQVAGVPFPDDLLHSNPGWVIVDQVIGSVHRLQGPFSEPSALAVYLSSLVFCCLWLSVRGYQFMQPNLLLALAIVSVLLSTSTTGIVMLVTGLPLVIGVASFGREPGAFARIGKTMGFLILGGAIVITPVLLLEPVLMKSIDIVMESTLNKGQSGSFDERTTINEDALATVSETYGLGVGWGSFRAMSFVPGLLANGGVFGVVMVAWMVQCILRLGARGRTASPGHPGQILVNGFSAALCGQFAAALISAPIITSPAFYLQLGCVVGVLGRMVIEPQKERRGRPVPAARAYTLFPTMEARTNPTDPEQARRVP
jgi:hypothetical protein